MPVDSMMPSFKLVFCWAIYVLQACVFAAPQDDTATALPAAEPNLGGPQNEGSSCGACYVVADVAAVVWYSEIFLNVAATRVLNVAVGNSTRATRTSTIINERELIIEPDPDAGDDGSEIALTALNFAPTYDIGSAKLYSPTAYNVFKAYTIRSEYESEGSCVTVTEPPITLPTAYSEPIPEASGRIYLNEEGQQKFIDYLELTSCRAGGERVTPIVVAQVQNSTAEITQYQTGPTLAPKTRSLARTTSAIRTTKIGVTTLTQIVRTVSVSVRGPSGVKPTPIPVTIPVSRYYPSVRVPVIVIGSSRTITPTANPLPLPIANGTVLTQPGAGVGSFTVELVVPTGGAGGGNFTTVAVVPYISRGNTWRKAGSSWVELSVAGAVGLCCAVLLYL